MGYESEGFAPILDWKSPECMQICIQDTLRMRWLPRFWCFPFSTLRCNTTLSADKFLLDTVDRVTIVKPDGQEIELNAEFSIPLTNPSSYEWWLLILDTKKDQVPIGSEVWIQKSLEEITRLDK